MQSYHHRNISTSSVKPSYESRSCFCSKRGRNLIIISLTSEETWWTEHLDTFAVALLSFSALFWTKGIPKKLCTCGEFDLILYIPFVYSTLLHESLHAFTWACFFSEQNQKNSYQLFSFILESSNMKSDFCSDMQTHIYKHTLKPSEQSSVFTHSEVLVFSEKTLRMKSDSLFCSYVDGTMTYSPGLRQKRSVTSRRLM